MGAELPASTFDPVRLDEEVVVLRVPPGVAEVVRWLLRLPAPAFEAVATIARMLASKHADNDKP